MKYLNPEQVLFIHARIIEETGGAHGVRDLGLLESAVARPQATFDGRDLHSNLFIKAAALLHALIKNHPFVDGNKRTGMISAGLFLRANGAELNATNKEMELLALKVAESKVEVKQIAEWLQKHSRS